MPARSLLWTAIPILLLAACSSGEERLDALVRSEPGLQRLDEQVRRAVSAAHDIGQPPADASLDDDQARWREGLAACLDDEDPARCVGDAYEQRLADLRSRYGLTPRAVALHAAAAEGYEFRGQGNEPGWLLLIGENRAVWETDYGQVRHVLEDLVVEPGPEGRSWTGRLDGQPLRISLLEGPCSDDMSGERFGWQVVIEHGDRTWRGCADRTR